MPLGHGMIILLYVAQAQDIKISIPRIARVGVHIKITSKSFFRRKKKHASRSPDTEDIESRGKMQARITSRRRLSITKRRKKKKRYWERGIDFEQKQSDFQTNAHSKKQETRASTCQSFRVEEKWLTIK